jgi:hypothetical protein
MTEKDMYKKRREELIEGTDQEVIDAASKFARQELAQLFLKSLERPQNKTHLDAYLLWSDIYYAGLANRAHTFVRLATCLGFLGRNCLLKLSKDYGEQFVKPARATEELFPILFEAADLSSEEYRRRIIDVLISAVSATKGCAEDRFKVLKNEAEDNADFTMKRGSFYAGFGLSNCTLLRFEGVPYIMKGAKGSGGKSTDAIIESMLSLYVDHSLASQMEKLLEKYSKTSMCEMEKDSSGFLFCPLFGAIQPPWCPICNGKVHFKIAKNLITYMPSKGLNEACPIIKEWLGEKTISG